MKLQINMRKKLLSSWLSSPGLPYNIYIYIYKYIYIYIYRESANYEIMCNFPRKNFLASEQLSLKELGLAPSSALVMHKMD